MRTSIRHQYIDRETAEVKTERLYFDRLVNYIYSRLKEHNKTLFNALISSRAIEILGYINFDLPLKHYFYSPYKLAHTLGVDLGECLDSGNTGSSPDWGHLLQCRTALPVYFYQIAF